MSLPGWTSLAAQPAVAKRDLVMPLIAAVAGVLISVPASLFASAVRLGSLGIVLGLIVGTLAAGIALRANTPAQWAKAAFLVAIFQLIVGFGILAILVMFSAS